MARDGAQAPKGGCFKKMCFGCLTVVLLLAVGGFLAYRGVKGALVRMTAQYTEAAPVELPAVTLRQDDGSFAEVFLGPGASIVFADQSLQQRMDAAIAAVGSAADANFRTLRIETTGKTQRTVRLSYVVAAPVWKAAYRIVPAEGRHRSLRVGMLELVADHHRLHAGHHQPVADLVEGAENHHVRGVFVRQAGAPRAL